MGLHDLNPSYNIFDWEAKIWSKYFATLLENYPEEIAKNQPYPMSTVMIDGREFDRIVDGERHSDLLAADDKRILVDYGKFDHANCIPSVFKLRVGDRVALHKPIHIKACREDERLYQSTEFIVTGFTLSTNHRYRTTSGDIAAVDLSLQIADYDKDDDATVLFKDLPSYMFILLKAAKIELNVNDALTSMGKEAS